MAKLKDLAIKGAGDRLLFDLDMIYEKPGYNVRQMDSPEAVAHIRKMADAIKANGTDAFPEITVFQEDDKVFVHRGHCRLRAHKLAKAEGAPVIGIRVIAAPKQNDAEHALDLLNSNDGLPLTPLEQAAAVERLRKFEWTPEMIAEKRGVSVTAIKNLIKLLEAPEPVKEMVRSGEVAARTATDVIANQGAEQGTETLKKAVQAAKEKGKERATPKHVKEVSPPAEKKGTDTQMPEQREGATPPTPPSGKKQQAGKVVSLQKASAGVDFEKWGPSMLKYIKRIRDVENIAELQTLQMQAAGLVKGYEK